MRDSLAIPESVAVDAILSMSSRELSHLLPRVAVKARRGAAAVRNDDDTL